MFLLILGVMAVIEMCHVVVVLLVYFTGAFAI